MLEALRTVGIVSIGGNGEDREVADVEKSIRDINSGDISDSLAAELVTELKQLSRISENKIQQAKKVLNKESQSSPETSTDSTFANKKGSFESTIANAMDEKIEGELTDHTSVLFHPDDHDSGIGLTVERGAEYEYVVDGHKMVQADRIDSLKGEQTGMILFSFGIADHPTIVTSTVEKATVTIETWADSNTSRKESKVYLREEGIAYQAVADLLPMVKSALEDAGIVRNLMIENVDVVVNSI